MAALEMRDAGDDLQTAYEKTCALVPHTRGCFMACICYCPKKAIEYGRASLGKPRYKCPEYVPE